MQTTDFLSWVRGLNLPLEVFHEEAGRLHTQDHHDHAESNHRLEPELCGGLAILSVLSLLRGEG